MASAQPVRSHPRLTSLLRAARVTATGAVASAMALPAKNVAIMTRPAKNAPCKFTHKTISGTSRQNNGRVPSCPRSKSRSCPVKMTASKIVNKCGRASQCMVPAIAASNVSAVAGRMSHPSTNSWRCRSHKHVAISTAANSAMPFHPNASPAAANSTSPNHSLEISGALARVWENGSARITARCSIIQLPMRQCRHASPSALIMTSRHWESISPSTKISHNDNPMVGSHRRRVFMGPSHKSTRRGRSTPASSRRGRPGCDLTDDQPAGSSNPHCIFSGSRPSQPARH